MMRCSEECGKKWRTGRQTKPEWKKQEEKEKKKERKRTMIEEEIAIARIGREEEKDMMKLRATDEMVSRWFHKYLKMFKKKKKDSERILMRKA